MTDVSYNDTLSEDRDKVRFWIQDTEEGRGPKPQSKNFTDGEINALIAHEGSWERAVAACFEILAAAWQPLTTFSAQGGSFARSDAASGYRKQAAEWREKYGDDDGATDELGARDVDFSGDSVSALFQREAFGNKVTDWDPS